MRLILSGLFSILFAAQSLPPAYPRPGAIKILDNDRVQVWNIAWLKGQLPLHRHVYDLVGVYYEPGDRMIISPEGARRPVTTKAGDIAFQRKGVTHIEEGVSDAPLRAVFIEMKTDGPSGQVDAAASEAPAFPRDGQKQLLDNDRVTVWESAGSAAGGSHRHTRDAVVIWLDGQTPHAVYAPRGTVHAAEPSGAAHAWIFELK